MAEENNICKITARLFVTEGSHSFLWLKDIPFDKSQRGYLLLKAVTVSCGWRKYHLINHREAICYRRLPQFVMAKGYSILKVIERLFVTKDWAEDHRKTIWQPKAVQDLLWNSMLKTFCFESHVAYSSLEGRTTICCDQSPQHLWRNKKGINNCRHYILPELRDWPTPVKRH